MNDEQKPESPASPGRAGVIVTVCLVVATAVVALFVVAKNARKVNTGPVPEALQRVAPDTGLAAFGSGMWRKTKALEKRCLTKEQQFQGRMTPAQDSLLQLSLAGTKDLRQRLLRLDSVPVAARKAAQDSIRAEYELVKSHVNAFTRSDKGGPAVNDDSLDAEVRKLIGK